jgi:hypothetical protein
VRSAALQARDAALLRLSRLHPTEYARLYDQERVARGLNPLSPRRAERIAELRAQLARLEAQEGTDATE